MIKTPAIKATRKLKAAEKQLVAKILHEIIALRHPEGYDEHDVDDENENVSIAIRHKIIQRYIFIYLCSHMKIYDMFLFSRRIMYATWTFKLKVTKIFHLLILL